MNDTELNINLKALKKVDPYIISIEAHSSQVALYKFHPGKGDWEKTEVEGTLFVYQREAEPQYGFTIMNRLNMDNLVEPVTKELDFQLQTPFLLYRNHAGDIYGIWFYEQIECERVGKRIEMLVKGVEKKAASKRKTVGKSGDLNQLFKSAEGDKPTEQLEPASDASGKNLLRLLSQTDQPNAVEGVAGGQPPPRQSEKTTASVKDFFAMASSNDIQSTSPQMGSTGQSAFTSVPMMTAPPHLPPTTMMSQGHPPLPITALPISQGLAMGAVPVAGYHIYPTPQHIMPPTTSLPPGHALSSNGSMANQPPPPPTSSSINPMVQRMMSNPGIHSVESIEAEQRRSTSPNRQSISPPDQMTPNTRKLTDLESQLKQKLHIGSSGNMFAPVKGQPKQPEPSLGKTHLTRQPSNLMPVSNTQPTLLSPQVFSSGRPTESPSPSRVNGHNGVGSSPPQASITPLTQPQMVEAMSFLLENDPDFVQRLHQAYVMSINRKFQIIK